jgi:hypothetical protein
MSLEMKDLVEEEIDEEEEEEGEEEISTEKNAVWGRFVERLLLWCCRIVLQR